MADHEGGRSPGTTVRRRWPAVSFASQPIRQAAGYLTEESRERLGLYLDGVYAYTQDPLVARLNPQVGIRPIEVRWEPGLADGPRYTCLSHDIIAHEAGHACLDGIRPYYYTFSSVQTAAFGSLPAGGHPVH